MTDQKLLKHFFETYGSRVTDCDGGQSDFGVLAPARRYGTDTDTVRWYPAGFAVQSEHVLLSLNCTGIIRQGASLDIYGERFRVVVTDTYRIGGKPLYLRAYLQKEVGK